MSLAVTAFGVTNAVHSNAVEVATLNDSLFRGIFMIPEGTPMFGDNRGVAGNIRIGFVRGAVGAWGNATTNAQQMLRNMIAIAEVSSSDTDGDGMPDTYEMVNGLDPLDNRTTNLVNGTDGDLDMDLLRNIDEYNRGTRADLRDTDDDGYEDFVETNDGSFDDVASDTGTDALDPDTDGDGLRDGVETNDGTFNDPSTDTGTHPLIADTDMDNYNDGDEVAQGTDPLNGLDFPSGLRVLFVGGSGTLNTPIGSDAGVFTFLEDRYGSNVVYRGASAVTTEFAESFELVVTSSTPSSGDLRGKFHNISVPLLNWEEAIADDDNGEFGMCQTMVKSSAVTSMVFTNQHVIADAFGSEVVLFTNAVGETTSTPDLFLGLTPVRIRPDNGNSMLFLAEVGDALLPSANVAGNVAPASRVMFPMTDGTFNNLSADGRELFGRALDWAAGILVETGGSTLVNPGYIDGAFEMIWSSSITNDQLLVWSTNLVTWFELASLASTNATNQLVIRDLADQPYAAFRFGRANATTNGCPVEGDTHCQGLNVTGGPVSHTLTASAVDDSGDAVLYTFIAQHVDGTVIVAGPALDNVMSMDLFPGVWTLSVEVDDDPACPDRASDARCSTVLNGAQRCSTVLNGADGDALRSRDWTQMTCRAFIAVYPSIPSIGIGYFRR